MIMEAIRSSQTEKSAVEAISNILTPENLTLLGVQENQKSAVVGGYTRPWYRYFLTYDPANYFKDKKLPILALNGELDEQVTANENLAGLRRILQNHDDATVTLLPNLNHMFQKAKTGRMNEYRQIEQTFSPDVLELITQWIKARV
jgi:hypothetical protein